MPIALSDKQGRTRAAHLRYRSKAENRGKERNYRMRPEVCAKLRETSHNWHRNNWERKIWAQAKKRAEKLGIPFSIKIQDIVVPKRCPVFGVELKIGASGRTGHNPCSPSLDRVDPRLGYVPGNVCVISMRANSLKNSLTCQELKAILKYVEKHTGGI